MTADLSNLEVGALGWVNVDSPEVWLHAEIVRVESQKLTVSCSQGSITVPPTRFVLRNADVTLDTDEGAASSAHDLSLLPNLNEPEALVALERRFQENKIYTFSGSILLAVNPFKVIPKLYDDPNTNEPHVYKVAKEAHRGMCINGKNQALLISGESGAGKTETTKFVLRYFASLYGRSEGTSIQRMVIESNPVLEALGNAKTLRNDNSSRFGKFIDLKFEGEQLVGAAVRTYLLEKVRVCAQSPGERSFHIFYQACAAFEQLHAETGVYQCGAVSTSKDWCGTVETKRSVSRNLTADLSFFGPASSFKYLNIEKLASHYNDDAAEFQSTLLALEPLNFSSEEIWGIMRTVAGVLRLGNIGLYERSAEVSAVTQDEELNILTECLGIQSSALEKALCHKTLRTTDGTIHAPVNVQKALESRDALARHLYGALFSAVCMGINDAFSSYGAARTAPTSIGVLDIFGFEFFEVNSFEQLCINYTNELLQQFFNTLVFSDEEALYAAEGIPWDPADFPSNEGVVAMLNSRPNGVFSMLDEECRVAMGTDAAWARKLLKSWGNGGNKNGNGIFMAAVKTNQEAFVVKHFAGDVTYQSNGFVDKNRDDISKDLMAVMNDSTVPYVQALFKKTVRSFGTSFSSRFGTAKVLKAKQYTVSGEFREQLEELMTSLHETQPTFVRCIKPNTRNVPNVFDRPDVVEQMRYQGVLQAIAVARAGYPVRWLHKDCWTRLCCLLDPASRARLQRMSSNPKSQCTRLLEKLTVSLSLPASGASNLRWAVGKTRVFLKQAPYEILEAARRKWRRRCAIMVQSQWRRYLARKRYLCARRCIISMQSLARRVLARWKVARMRRQRAACIVQRHVRGFVRRTTYRHMKVMCITIQAHVRGVLQRRRYGLILRKICRIQSLMRRAGRRIRALREWEAVARIERFANIVLAKREVRTRAVERLRVKRATRILIRLRITNVKKRATRERLMNAYRKPSIVMTGYTASTSSSNTQPNPDTHSGNTVDDACNRTASMTPLEESAAQSNSPEQSPRSLDNTQEDRVICVLDDLCRDAALEPPSTVQFLPLAVTKPDSRVPDLGIISTWSATDVQMVLNQLMDENRLLQARLEKSDELQERYTTVLERVEGRLDPLSARVNELDGVLQRDRDANFGRCMPTNTARALDTSYPPDAPRTTCGAAGSCVIV
eukprot:GEMP01002676.1.p1 GENE.GEMP01002676.1~~GEMP01002676.1.p1  ORF type:complete len:1183 (+),score=272.76 GEMP01002676.1:35-3583(+)